MKAIRWADAPKDTVESRPHARYAGRSDHGRSTTFILCPFCGCEMKAYLWSLAGGGKRCECGALHGSSGNSIAWRADA